MATQVRVVLAQAKEDAQAAMQGQRMPSIEQQCSQPLRQIGTDFVECGLEMGYTRQGCQGSRVVVGQESPEYDEWS
jgi:hypothetical protein